VVANLLLLLNLTWLITCLKGFQVDASRLGSLLLLKPCMSSFVAFGSRRISLIEHSPLSFALVVPCLCADEDLPLSSGDTDEGYQWEVQTDEG
jgi:hypothetical protein